MKKLLISFTTYPRDGIKTYELLEKTFNSMIEGQDLSSLTIKIIVVGDDMMYVDHLEPIFKNFDCEVFNININDALRNMLHVPKEVRWRQAVQRSKIFILEKALEYDFDYILMSADDEIYMNNKITTSIEYIEKYNNPDFVFSLGMYLNNTIIPENRDIFSQPESGKCISSGCLYNLRNKIFINTMLQIRKNKWQNTLDLISSGKSEEEMISYIKPEDSEMWHELWINFNKKYFTSILIPIVLINHSEERTLFNYLDE